MSIFPSNDKQRLYKDLAWTWPIISPPEDYTDETEEFISLIRKYARISVESVLNLGCGGGHNDFTLKKSFNITSVDISESMLRLAGQLNPEVKYLKGDMRSVRLGQSFDAVTIFDSINYMYTRESLKGAFMTAYTHLRPGGAFVTYLEEWQEKFIQNKCRCQSSSRDEIEITLFENLYDPDPTDNMYESNFIFLIRREGDLSIEHDCHILGLFKLELWTQLLMEVGFDVRRIDSTFPDQEGNSLPIFIAVKPLRPTT